MSVDEASFNNLLIDNTYIHTARLTDNTKSTVLIHVHKHTVGT